MKLLCNYCGNDSFFVDTDKRMFLCTKCFNKYLFDATGNNEENDFEIVAGELRRYIGSNVDVTVPEGVKIIQAGAFLNHTFLESIRLPSSLIKIGDSAFSGCSALRKIYFQEGLEEIGFSAFKNCSELEEIIIPNSIKIIRADRRIEYDMERLPFEGCIKLKFIEYPKHIPIEIFKGSLFYREYLEGIEFEKMQRLAQGLCPECKSKLSKTIWGKKCKECKKTW